MMSSTVQLLIVVVAMLALPTVLVRGLELSPATRARDAEARRRRSSRVNSALLAAAGLGLAIIAGRHDRIHLFTGLGFACIGASAFVSNRFARQTMAVAGYGLVFYWFWRSRS